MYTLDLNTRDFLQNYWQKKPLLIKKAFPNFEDIITSDELAGLACEEEVSSRVVVTTENDCNIHQGPFEDYAQFGERNWQLLVQALNHWYPETNDFIQAFRFIPDWRFDDLMVSFATPGGGVGAHIDNYDVFIIQGEGKRQWTVGNKGQYASKNNSTTTPLIEGFEPIIDVILEKGDMLYIPPGFPHQGQTITTAMSYSMGFRAPSQQELFSEVADNLIDNNAGLTRFTSQDEPPVAGLISQAHQQGMMDLLKDILQDPNHYQALLGKVLSQNRFDLDICEPEENYTSPDLKEALSQGASLYRIGGLKVLQVENDPNHRLFINGEQIDFSNIENKVVQDVMSTFVDQLQFDNTSCQSLCKMDNVSAIILSLLNKGYYYLSE
ncbi:cupin domain-containing protein [Shewanella surugensis]|uniref:Cupin domain-containing protein n=1 Tax=Shewanella surugensis TaxID=212020 RepID=A0ABT0LGG5_9GAMM|nr:cupin domain-containing protein [Shewanella surugensis]MCL1126791.1 cupin domain-containing protein [Shewanella surugensis]